MREEPFKLSDLVELGHLLNHISFNLIWKVQCLGAPLIFFIQLSGPYKWSQQLQCET